VAGGSTTAEPLGEVEGGGHELLQQDGACGPGKGSGHGVCSPGCASPAPGLEHATGERERSAGSEPAVPVLVLYRDGRGFSKKAPGVPRDASWGTKAAPGSPGGP